MRTVYFVQSHRGVGQVARLARTLLAASPDAQVVVGQDRSGHPMSREDLPASPRLDLFHVEGPIERGRLSMLRPFLEVAERLQARGTEYDWLVHLSGQDYPVRPLRELEALLADSDIDGYIRFWPAFATDTPWQRPRQGLVRYGFRYWQAPRSFLPLLRVLRALNGVQRLVHVHLVYAPLVGLRALRTPFGPALPCMAGKQWSILRRACVEHLAARMREEEGVMSHYARCICPDESVLQTLLVSSGKFRLANDDLRFVDFRGSRDGRPRLLGEADYQAMTAPGFHFARKFDPSWDARILDRLDARIFAPAG